jgi:prepilin-type N-terminal cleavage/methylation domain-containing protein
MKRRQAGFSFIEILVVMGIISVLVSMVVFVVPMIQENTRRTKSSDNVQQMIKYYIADGAGVSKPWPAFNGKNFVLWLVATGKIDRRDDKQLQALFSPGDTNYSWDGAGVKSYAAITKESLRTENSELLKLTSYAGRRNATDGHKLTPDELSKGALCICDDDDGALHHPKGLVIGYVSGAAKFVAWDELDMSAPADPNNPENTLGDQSPNPELKHMSSGN